MLPASLEGAVHDLLQDQAQPLARVAQGVEGARPSPGTPWSACSGPPGRPAAQKSKMSAKGPSALRSATIRSTRLSPTLRTAARPKTMAGPSRSPVRSGGELGHRAVHVGHQHLDAHGPALGEVDGGLVLVVLDRGQQGGHVLDGVVRLQPCRLVRHEAVAVGVRLVERVVGEGLDDVEELRPQLLAVALGRRTRRRTSRAPRRSAPGSSCRRPCAGCRLLRACSPRTSGRPASPTPGRASARRCP